MEEKTVLILLVEDSPTCVTYIRNALESAKFSSELIVAQTIAQAHACLEKTTPHIAIVDLCLPDGEGKDLLLSKKGAPAFPVIIISGQGNEQAAVEAMKLGAFDYIVKSPESLVDITSLIERALREWGLILKRKEAQQKLEESEVRFRSFFDSSASGMAIVSPDGKPIRVNSTFCSISGYSKEEALTISPLEVTHPDDRETSKRFYDEIRSGQRKVVSFEKRYICKDGSVVWGHVTLAGVFDSSGSLSYYAANVQDITERKLAEQELKSFAYAVSHDLRTPLSLITSYADIVFEQNKKTLDGQTHHYLSEIIRSAEKMALMLDDLLSLATIGKVKTPIESIDIKTIVSEIVDNLSEKLKKADIKIEVHDLPVLAASRTLVIQMFENLINNAIKHGSKQGDIIEVGCDQDSGKVCFYVRDHGVGVPEEERMRIFDLFYRGSNAKNINGTGIGLATVQRIVKHFPDGRLWVEETPGGGSTFKVEFTLVPGNA